MTADPRAAAIVAGVIRLARSLDLDVVAEGVSGTDVSRALLALGCRRGQGNASGRGDGSGTHRDALRLTPQVMPRSGVWFRNIFR